MPPRKRAGGETGPGMCVCVLMECELKVEKVCLRVSPYRDKD
jgi:hypothetical protein